MSRGLVDGAEVHADDDVLDPAHAEVRRHGGAQLGLRPTTVLCARGPPQGHRPEVASTAPVAANVTEGQEPGRLAVWRHADAVDTGAADDADAPVRPVIWHASPQHGERVVDHGARRRPAERLHQPLKAGFLDRQVGPGQARRRVLGDRSIDLDARLLSHFADQGGELFRRLLAADSLVVGRPAANRCQQRAVGCDQRHVSLAVAAVDGEDRRRGFAHRPAAHERNSAFSASSRSVRPWARSYWPTSGCANSAAATLSRPPCSAAASASSSYADTCAMRPFITGLTGATGTGTGPADPIIADTSMTASSAKNGSVPLLRTLTTWRSRVSLSRDAIRATAASE